MIILNHLCIQQAHHFANPLHHPFGESENTTHSYSNSLLEDNIEYADNSDSDFEADEQFDDVRLLTKINRTPNLSDLNNGKFLNDKHINSMHLNIFLNLFYQF